MASMMKNGSKIQTTNKIQKASSFDSPRDGPTKRRSLSDITGYKQPLVAISPLLAAAASPGAPPSLVPVDEAADNKSWLLDSWLLESSPLALSPDAAARHLPNLLLEMGLEDGIEDSRKGSEDSYVLPETPSPLLHAAMWPQKRMPSHFDAGANGENWEWGDRLFDDVPRSRENWEGNGPAFQDLNIWEDNSAKAWQGLNTYWDQDAESYQGTAPWDMQWNQDDTWAAKHWNVPAADGWGTQTSAQVRRGGPETPEKPVKNMGQAQKRAQAHVWDDVPYKEEEEIGYEHKRSGDVRAPEISGTDTTVMLRNIPNKYSRDMLVEQLGQNYKGMFDFMYLPIDFKNKCNVGYGFVNFRTAALCSQFVQGFNGVDVRKCLPGFNSRKVVEVTPARVQGLQDNIRRLRNSPVMSQLKDHPDWLPLLFDDDGQEQPFPQPEHPLPPVRVRGSGRHKTMQW